MAASINLLERFEVSRETRRELERFEALFRSWNARINLVADSTLDDFWNRHVLDSAQLVRLAPTADRWLDIGSGGGFPGLVIAFLLGRASGRHIDLVESNRRKAAFLQSAVGEFDLPAQVHALRIEHLKLSVTPQIVTARAVASLAILLDMSAPWLTKEVGGSVGDADGGPAEHGPTSVEARGLFHKGRDYRAEVAESAHSWQFDLIEHPSLTDREAVILELSALRRRAPVDGRQ